LVFLSPEIKNIGCVRALPNAGAPQKKNILLICCVLCPGGALPLGEQG
jgi:hypothetical protein